MTLARLCINCGAEIGRSSQPYLYHPRSKIFKSMFPSLSILRCKKCNVKQVDHNVISSDQLTTYYEKAYRRDTRIAADETSGANPIYLARAKALAELSSKYITTEKNLKIFEPGYGYGYNLRQFATAFPNSVVYGNDLDAEIGVPDGICAASISDHVYDIVILSHVLEHFIHPKNYITEILRNLRSGGILVIEVPNESEEYTYLQFHEPHLTFFEMSTLQDFFVRNFSQELLIERLTTAGPILANFDPKRTDQRVRTGRKKISAFLEDHARPIFNVAKHIYDLTLLKPQETNLDFSHNSDHGDRIFLRGIFRKL